MSSPALTEAPAARPFAGRRAAILAAHPDDEIIGAGGQLAGFAHLLLIHLTDGAPSRRAARAHGFDTTQAYADARRRELDAALAAATGAAVPIERECLRLPDGRASFRMAQAARHLAVLLDRARPELLLTQPYEGGHPDHDAAAFIARAALRLSGSPVPLWEMTAYHAAGGTPAQGVFIPHPAAPETVIRLSPSEQAAKRAALAAFVSQQAVLAEFPVTREAFRPAPPYDFTASPHPGRLHYENRRRAMTGKVWRGLAADAEAGLRRPSATRMRPVLREAVWRVWLAG